jgi:hypothetical protein
MKHLTVVATLLTAGPAFAHNGAHIHPHGSETSLLFLAAILIAGAGLLAARR